MSSPLSSLVQLLSGRDDILDMSQNFSNSHSSGQIIYVATNKWEYLIATNPHLSGQLTHGCMMQPQNSEDILAFVVKLGNENFLVEHFQNTNID
jgi:hypothetical protein